MLGFGGLGFVLVLVCKFCRRVLAFGIKSPHLHAMSLTVNFGILELSGGYFIIKEHVNLAKCAVLCLREAKPAPDITKKVCTSIKEACFSTPVPS